MSDSEKKFWFPAKRYGWGWGFPVAWQGWMTMIVYLLFFLAGLYIFQTTTLIPEIAFILYIIGLTVVLLGICWLKGEKPRWRWGDK